MWAVAAVATALFALWPAATIAFGQATEGDDVQYSAVCQNILGQIGDITQNQTGTAGAVAIQYGEAAAEVAQEQGVSIAQVNECLNGIDVTRDDVKDDVNDKVAAGVIVGTIPDQKVLADTGGMPLFGLAIIGLGLVAAGASLLRFGGRR